MADNVRLNGEVIEILQKLARIEQRLDDMVAPQCLVNAPRLDKLEQSHKELSGVVGKQNFIAAVVSAVTAGLVLSTKWLVSK